MTNLIRITGGGMLRPMGEGIARKMTTGQATLVFVIWAVGSVMVMYLAITLNIKQKSRSFRINCLGGKCSYDIDSIASYTYPSLRVGLSCQKRRFWPKNCHTSHTCMSTSCHTFNTSHTAFCHTSITCMTQMRILSIQVIQP